MLYRKESWKMIRIGRGGLWNNSYKDEIVFAKRIILTLYRYGLKMGNCL